MKKKVYLINPKESALGYFTWPNDSNGLNDHVLLADLVTTTVAKLMENHFEVEICESALQEVNFDTDADFIAITGKISQWRHVQELSAGFKKRGKTVILGGSFASLSHERVRPYADILIRGEIEDIADEMFAEIASGNWKPEYKGTQPDMAKSPIPRWDLYPNQKAMLGAIQISRGCPFQCEFCDVIEYLGRKQRHKPVDNIIKELDNLYKHGYRDVFIADDNLTIYRKKAKAILQAIGDWNQKQTQGPVIFKTQVSIDIAKDEEMMNLASYAGLHAIFVGIETPNVDSLKESRKFQNLRIDLVDQVHTIFKHGLSIYGGMIVGFDNDTPDIFERQFNFISRAAIPYVTYGLLNAPDQTPLFTRLEKDDRLIKDDINAIAGNPYATNILFKNISQEEAQLGSQWLMNNLYAPKNFGERISKFIDLVGQGTFQANANERLGIRDVDRELFKQIRLIPKMGEEETKMYNHIRQKLKKAPHAILHVRNYFILYRSIRAAMKLNNTWDQSMVDKPVFEVSY